MWFRVELHKDGSVASCETVEGKLKDGKHVFYVEAETREKALKEVVRRYQRSLDYHREYERRRRETRRANNQCSRCTEARVPGKAMCKRHLEIARELVAAGRNSGQREKKSLEERAAAHEESAKRSTSASNSRSRERFGMSTPYASVCRRVLLEVLEAYDDNPAGFRSWLTGALERLGTREGAYKPILNATAAE